MKIDFIVYKVHKIGIILFQYTGRMKFGFKYGIKHNTNTKAWATTRICTILIHLPMIKLT